MVFLCNSSTTTDEASRHHTALKVLSKCFVQDNLLFIYVHCKCIHVHIMSIVIYRVCRRQTMDKVLAIDRPSPRVAAFIDNQKRQYFVITERRVLWWYLPCHLPCFTHLQPIMFLIWHIRKIQHPDSVGRTI